MKPCFYALLYYMSEYLRPVLKKEHINFLREESYKSTPNHHYPTLSLSYGEGYPRGIKNPDMRKP